MSTLQTVRFITDAGNPNLPTVNVSGSSNPAFEQVLQTATNSRTFATWQDSGGAVEGLKTVYVSGYTPP